MAKAGKSKSDKIQDALIATPDKPVNQIAKEAGATAGLVYQVKGKMKKNGGKPHGKPGRKRGRKPGAKAAAPDAAHAALDSAFEFVVKVGGLLHAEQLIGKLKAFKERL